MNNYRMKALQKLDEAEEQVKQGVRMKLKEPVGKQQKKVVPLFAGVFASLATIVLLVFLIQPKEGAPVVNGSGAFTVSEVTLTPLKLRESSYVAVDLKWDSLEEAVLDSIELVNFYGEPVQYNTHNLEMRPWKVTGVEPGQYRYEEISALEEFTQIEFEPNSKRSVLLELIGNVGFEQSNDFELRLVFTVNGERIVQTVDWATLDTVVVEQLNFVEVVIGLGVTEEEISAYEAFKKERGPVEFADLTPTSIARLYWLADIEGDDGLQYGFYAPHEETSGWSYEEQLTFPAFDRHSLDEAIELFQAVSSGTFIETGDDSGYIAFTMDGTEQGFQLIKNKDGIWQVAFMPLQ